MPLAALAAAGIGGSIIGAIGANSAAGKQADAANNAANLQFQASNNALNFEKQQYNNSLQLFQPYYNTGIGALDLLRTGLGIPGAAPDNFQFPGSTPTSGNNIANLRELLGDSPIDRLGMIRGGGTGPQPIQASAMGGMVPSANATSAMVPSAGGLPNRINGVSPINAGTGVINFGGEAAVPGGPINPGATPGMTSASNGTLEVPRTGGGADQTAGGGNVGFGSLLQSYPGGPFVPPDAVTEQNDPGYLFRLQQGMDAEQNMAAARGGLLSGGTAKALEDFAQNDASNEYQNVYNRALNTYGTNYNSFVNNQANQFNRLAAIAGLGQTSAQDLSTAGLTTSNMVGNNLLGTAGAVGQDIQNAGAARASGITGMTNAITGGIGNLSLLSMLINGQGGGAGADSGMGVI